MIRAITHNCLPRIGNGIRVCCEELVKIIRKVVLFVARIFRELARSFFDDVPPPPVFRRVRANREIIRPLVDQPKSARYFLNLIRLSPLGKSHIGPQAIAWAAQRPVRVDPQHRYFEIIQEAFKLRNQIEGGADCSSSYETYETNDPNYYAGTAKFAYIIYSLCGFQELDRPENRDLCDLLDNQAMWNGMNPAYDYATALSKIYAYPVGGGVPVDIRGKLKHGREVPWLAYQAAKAKNRLVEFFNKGFQNENCFDARVADLQEFMFKIEQGNCADFYPALVPSDKVETKVTKHYEAFRNQQILKFTNAKNLPYEAFKDQVVRGVDNVHTRDFRENYYTRDRFAGYLQENDQPIRQRTSTLAPLPRQWQFGIPYDRTKDFIEVQYYQINETYRQLGKIVALREEFTGNYYLARVHRIRGDKIDLDQRGEPVQRGGAQGWERILDTYGL